VATGICAEDDAVVISSSGVRTDRFRRADVPPDAVRRIRLEVGAESDDVVVTMISRLIRSKGVLEFARAASTVGRQTSRVKFLLVGPEDPRSLERLSSSELQEVRMAVRWIGPRTDIPAILAASDIFALPSFYREGVPRVLLEAAAIGVPLISSLNPGSEEVVSDGVNGILVPPQDAEALSMAILRLASDPGLRAMMGENARRLAVEEFDVERVARKTGDLYWRLLRTKGLTGTKAGGAHTVATVPHTFRGA
jgi:glycosyltransferase involved in cell wall biosynthesis